MVRDQILRSEAARRGARRHIFGAVPSDPWMEEYIQEVWLSDQPLMEQMDSEMDPVERGLWLSQWIAMARQGQAPEENPLGQALTQDAARLMERLKSSAACEMESLMRALSGGYVSPGPAGDAMSNGRGILPAGAISTAWRRIKFSQNQRISGENRRRRHFLPLMRKMQGGYRKKSP